MSWVARKAVTVHRCRQPRHEGKLGDLWRCDDCRELWRVGFACVICDAYGGHGGRGGHCMVGTTWRPATLWQRIRHRRDG